MTVETMRCSVMHGVGDVRLEHRPMPEPGAGEVLVRVSAVGVCGSDMHFYERGRIGDCVVTAPLILGHEAGGVVARVGPGVTRCGERTRVSIEPGIPCRGCQQCLTGHYNLCPSVRFFATPPIDGAFAEYVVMPELFVYPVPDSMSDDASALIEPLSVGVWACRRGSVGPGSRVLVVGAGPIGLLAGQVAQAFGASRVLVTDVNDVRLAEASRLGMDTLNTSDTTPAAAGFTADTALECSGNASASVDALRALTAGGTAVLVGLGADELTIPLPVLQDRELTVTGSFRYANTWPVAIDLAASGKVELDSLVTGHFSLERAADALEAPHHDAKTIKSVVTP